METLCVIPVRAIISEAEMKHEAPSNALRNSSDHESSTSSVCSDHLDCDNWGPAVFVERHGFADILAANEMRHMAPNYDMVTLLEEIVEVETEHDPVFVVNLSTVMSQLYIWKRMMPCIQPFYAVICKGDDAITRMLSELGCGFDCACKAEIAAALSFGCPADLIIYANPCTQASMLRYARSVGVKKMTADNIEELQKNNSVFPEAHVVLRIAVDDSNSVCRCNSKFGAPRHEWEAMLESSREIGIEVVGFSFRVGSGCDELKVRCAKLEV